MTEILPEPDDEARATDRIIVAIPTATEPIHHIGDVSEPKHLTVLWLGSPEENPELDMDAITEAVRAVAEQLRGPLTAPVETQGPLGDDGAQVAFVGGDGDPGAPRRPAGRPGDQGGRDAVEQYPEFTPARHARLRRRAAVAEEDLPEEVIFDRLALWDGDEHTEFPLGPSASTEENTDGPEADQPSVIDSSPPRPVSSRSPNTISAENLGRWTRSSPTS